MVTVCGPPPPTVVVQHLDSMSCGPGAGKARLYRALCASMGDHDEPEISEAGEAARNEPE